MKRYYFHQRGKTIHRPKGQSRKSKLDGRARFNYDNKDDPNYKKNYGKEYTEKQLLLLNGVTPWETTPINQITILMRKAEAMGDTENYEKAKHLHQLKRNQDVFVSDLSTEEAIGLLQILNRRQHIT